MKEWEKVNKTLQEVSKERDDLFLKNIELKEEVENYKGNFENLRKNLAIK